MSAVIAQTNEKELAPVLTGEALLFGLLGKLLYAYPDEELIQPLLDENVFSEAPFAEEQAETGEGLELLQGWGASFGNKLNREVLTDVQSDYTRLFTGVLRVPVSPWESVYFNDEHLLFQEQTMDVRAWFRRFGLEAEKIYKEPEDHIGLELVFVGHLAQLALAALENGDIEAHERALQAKKNFLSQHLMLWGPTWCQGMRENAKTDFYRGLASLVWGALREAAEIFELRIVEPTKQ